MALFFQKKYLKISVSCLLIFVFVFQFFPAPQKTQAVKAESRSTINYLDICEPKVPFYDEALQTDELQEACYLLKKIQDRAAQEVTVARKMFELTDPFTKCNPIFGEEFPYVTTGNCKTACAWGFPEFEISIDITMMVICFFYPGACAGKVAEVAKVLKLLNKILDFYDIYKKFKLVLDIIQDVIALLQDAQELTEKLNELLAVIPDIDLSELNEFYKTLMEMVRLKYDVQQEVNQIEGKVYQMRKTVGTFSGGQLEGIYGQINKIGEIFVDKILAPGQSPDPENGDQRPFVEKELKEINEAARNLTCGEHCDNIKNLVASSIAKNDEIQQTLYGFYQTGAEEGPIAAMIGMLGVICQTKGSLSTVLSSLGEIENEISQASDSNYLDDIQDGIDEIKPTFEELSNKISQLESGEIQNVESCEGRADEESCGDFRWCLGGKCMEYYWQKTGTKSGWCCRGDRTQCLPIQYGNERQGGSKGEYGGVRRYVNCGIPFCLIAKVGKYKCERKEIIQEEEPWPAEEACRLRDHFELLRKLEGIMDALEEIRKKVGKMDVDLETTNAQIESDSESIREDLENIKNKIDEIRPELIEFVEDEIKPEIAKLIEEAKAELDALKPKIDELETKALEVMKVINLLKAIQLIQEIINLVKQLIENFESLKDNIKDLKEFEAHEELKKLPEYEATVGFQVGSLWDMIKCLPATGIYGKYTAESSGEIPCPTKVVSVSTSTVTSTDPTTGETTSTTVTTKKYGESTKYVGGRVCSDLQVPFNQLSSAVASILFNFNKIRDIERAGNPEVAPVVSKASQLWERSLWLESWAIFLKYMTDKCSCGRSYCRLTFGISGISITSLDPLLNTYCWLGWTFGRKFINDEADKLENANKE